MQIKTPPWRGPRADFFPSRSYFYLKSFLYLLFHSQAFVKYFCICNFKVCACSFANFFCIFISKLAAPHLQNFFAFAISKLAAPNLQITFAFAISKSAGLYSEFIFSISFDKSLSLHLQIIFVFVFLESDPFTYIRSRPFPLGESSAKIPFFIFKTIQTRPTVKIIWPRPEIPAMAGTDTSPSVPITS